MKILTDMSPADHQKAGYELYVLREQMILLVSPQLKYATNRRNRKMHGRLTRQLDNVIYSLDNVRDFLNTVAAHELSDNLDFLFYYPGSQDVEVPFLLAGISTERANRFHQNSMRRDLLESDGRRTEGIDCEDGNTLFLFFNNGVRDSLEKLSTRSEQWRDKRLAKKLSSLRLNAKSSASALAVSLQNLR